MEHGLRDSESSQTSEFSSSTSAKGAPTKLPFQPLQSLRHDQRTVASTKKENTAAASDITGYHQGAEEENVGAVEDYRVDVGWEGGDADPENPRSMHRGRKWLIVIILSWSSINVRWTFYLLLIWAGAMLTSIFLFVPETYHPVLLQKKARRLRRESGNENLVAPMERRHLSIPKTILWSLIRPFQLLTLEPMCLLLCIFSALLLGILYLFFGTIPLVFGTNHGFNPWQNGLAFMGILVGMVFGVATGPFWDRNYQRLVEVYELQGGEFSGGEPEFRLPPAIAGGVLVPIGLFWFAWTTYPSVHWIVPIMGSVVFAMG
ncbi:MAG: hypothetical protein M1829_003734 [Trizodia sp. TS-e1964]|nr:MAG: hypothetical protein M1829_003734 [Trizodia sp. TS-e1964]